MQAVGLVAAPDKEKKRHLEIQIAFLQSGVIPSGVLSYLRCRWRSCGPACCWPCRWSVRRRRASRSRPASLRLRRLCPRPRWRRPARGTSWSGAPCPRPRCKPAWSETRWRWLTRGAPPLRRRMTRGRGWERKKRWWGRKTRSPS